MRAVVLRAPEQLEVADAPEFVPGPGQAIVEVHRCGICGSDVRYFFGENPWAKQTLGREVPNPPNIILGHEFVGTVTAVHPDEDRSLIGQRVAVNTFITCGRCYFCRNGQENLCEFTKHLGHGQGWGEMEFYPGGMAERCPVFASQLYPLPDHVSDDQATFLDPIIASLHAVDVGAPKPLDRVAILGAGPVGLLIAQLVKAYGAVQTFITDVADENIAVAKKIGVDFPLNVNKDETTLHQCVMETTSGLGVDLVFNTVGSADSIRDSLRLVKKGGSLILLATKEDEIRFPSLLLSGERAVKTSSNAMYSDFPRAIDLLASRVIDVDSLITHRFPLTRAVDAFKIACNKAATGAIKIVLECQK